MAKDILLEIKNLVTEFRTEDETVKAVNNISFTLSRGETVGIVGESGSGKSVTSLSVMRLIPNPPGKITGGEIIYHSRSRGPVDIVKLSEKEMRSLRGNEDIERGSSTRSSGRSGSSSSSSRSDSGSSSSGRSGSSSGSRSGSSSSSDR